MINRSDTLTGMQEIGLKDLPALLSPAIKSVQAGASVLLTKYNREVAVIVPVKDFEHYRWLTRKGREK